MRHVAGYRTWITVLGALVLVAAAQAAGASLTKLIEAVLAHGPDSQLPAHMSVLLGLTDVEKPIAVKQAVKREGATVRTINVSTANHADVVLINYNEQSKASKAYLISAAGELRKALAFKAGAPAIERRPTEAEKDCERELSFWSGVASHPAVGE
jgi:hypothetical protein